MSVLYIMLPAALLLAAGAVAAFIIATRNGHGTGCTLSSAVAAQLALGLPLAQAVRAARAYILGAIAAGAEVRTGQGAGPLNHGYAPLTQRVRQ